MLSGTKNPGSILGKEWPSKCSNDPSVINSWPAGSNIGVLLGSNSGLIDLEYDSDLGEQLVNDWMAECGNTVTPTYKSAKSVHRLFKWDDKFALEGAKFGHMGVEFRFGCNVAQSVIPPSLHESGVHYEWLEGLSPWECEVAALPENVYKNFLIMKSSQEKAVAKAVKIDPRYQSGDSLLTKARNHIEKTMDWETILAVDGWKFCRNRGNAQDWWRPGKTKGSISATVNFGDSNTLRVFSTSCDPLEPDSSYDKFAYLCITKHGDDPVKAAFALCPKESLERKNQPKITVKNRPPVAPAVPTPPVVPAETVPPAVKAVGNLRNRVKPIPDAVASEPSPDAEIRIEVNPVPASECIPVVDDAWVLDPEDNGIDDPETDEDFMATMVPKTGMIRAVYQYYQVVSQYPSAIFGMATALTFCQTMFGRRIRSQTDLRTNDYNIAMGTTGCGKEACENTIYNLFKSVGKDLCHPSDMQSGNGLLAAIHAQPHGLWLCDEFGIMLESIIDPKSNPHLKNIAAHLLKFYTKANKDYGGAGHASGVRNKTIQPHLSVLGMSTPLVLSSITAKQVDQGLFGRLAFFVCQDRPKKRISPLQPPKEFLVKMVQRWIEWEPMRPGNVNKTPNPEMMYMTPEAWDRWDKHSDDIREKMDMEGELRAAVWVRVAERTMKLAMTHRAARLAEDPAHADWGSIHMEMEDIDWAIKLSNHIGRVSCNLLLSEVEDRQMSEAQTKILTAVRSQESITQRVLSSNNKKITTAQFNAAALALEAQGLIKISRIKPQNGGREKVVYIKTKKGGED